jgi:hypothetical protein
MNIFTGVINNPTTADISTSAGLIQIAGFNKLIPQKGITSAQRLALGSWPQAWTWTPASASIGQTYTLTVSGADTVSGVLRTWVASYKALTSTVADLTAALTAIINGFGSCPVTATDGSTLVTVTSKATTATSTAAESFKLSANVGTVANAPTLGLGGTLAIATTGVVTGSSSSFDTELPVGSILIVNDGVDFYRGFVATSTSSTAATVVPVPPAAIAAGSKGYAITSNGAYLEANDVLAGTSGVELTATNTYCVYVINFIESSLAGNGARPDMIQSQALLFVNAEDADLFSATGFDVDLAAVLGVIF